ncbi:MAG: nucleotidyltransferase [Bacteroidetes bacterium]|jgi:glucose-1-phosphate thymidylyltransferase|nr:nucleotidyltransferase [Bacteroidota bacterium]
MNLIIPMAGMGKRMRPHTLTIPKPLFKIAGKTIVQRLIEDISATVDDKIDNIGFVIGDFGKETENYLLDIARDVGSSGHIYYQHEPLGTAHAVYMAGDLLVDKCIVAFADTLFKTNSKIQNTEDNVIWTYEVDDPSAYGVVKTDHKSVIHEFIEKPDTPVSNKAIIGIYYFSKGELLRDEINAIIEKNQKVGTEFQLTTALENLKNKQKKFISFTVDGWYDCGNWKETIETNRKVLDNAGSSVYDSVQMENTLIIDPVFIGNNVILRNSIIGPHVSVEDHTEITDSIVRNSIIKSNSVIDGCVCDESIIGQNVTIKKEWSKLNVGDYTIIK